MPDGFEDLFQGDTFEDAKIQVGGDLEPGQQSDPPPGKGQDSDPPPGDQKDTDPNKTNKDIKDDDTKGKKDLEKDTPFDKNPKWIKARAAEKMLQGFMDDHGFLDIEEAKEALLSGKTLSEALGEDDLEALKKDSVAYKEYKDRMEQDELDPDPNPNTDDKSDEKLLDALREVKKLKGSLDDINENTRQREADKNAFKNYSSDVDKVLGVLGDELSLGESETTLFKSVMGIDNPSTEVDIENKLEVRTMVKNSAKQFKTTLEEIKQKAIDDFAAGKSKMVVTDPKVSADLESHTLNKKNYDPEKQSVDEIFDSGKNELIDLISQSMQSAN